MLFFSKGNNSQLTDMSLTLNFCRKILGHFITTANVLFFITSHAIYHNTRME